MTGPGRRSRLSYLGVTALIAAAGWAAALRLAGWRAGDAALGLGAAWAIQAVSFWRLAGKLGRGEDPLAAWAAGIAARVAGLAVLWVGGWTAGRRGPDLIGSYALGLLAFLLAEAAWLAVPPRRARRLRRDGAPRPGIEERTPGTGGEPTE